MKTFRGHEACVKSWYHLATFLPRINRTECIIFPLAIKDCEQLPLPPDTPSVVLGRSRLTHNCSTGWLGKTVSTQARVKLF